METRKCDYCGNEYDISFFETLDNGSEACANCVREEEKCKEKKTAEN
jgi:hypothetical protein